MAWGFWEVMVGPGLASPEATGLGAQQNQLTHCLQCWPLPWPRLEPRICQAVLGEAATLPLVTFWWAVLTD